MLVSSKKLNVIGGGPGGLFLAILLRTHRPQWEVQVWERNPPHATFGFGVVFSDRTIERLDNADPILMERIRAEFQSWTDIEIGTPKGVRRTGGHGFSAIARHRLLAILQQRARELQVSVLYEREALDFDRLYEDCDLLIGADGINSLVRERWAEEFKPDIRTGSARFIWFATPRRYDALTFHFVQTPYGPFSTHAYPFSEELSTFIVEVDVETWRRAGLDPADRSPLGVGETDEFSKSFCEEIFRDSLQGHSLTGNASQWRQFPTLRNGSWRAADKVVILGDAAHTAHFSVGSGTKMAMEDAATLAEVLINHEDPVESLVAYEQLRKPSVTKIQQLAEPSRGWWENFRDWVDRDLDAVSVNFLTRTGLETVEHLAKRDPAFAMQTVRGAALDDTLKLTLGIALLNRRGIHLPVEENERRKILAAIAALEIHPSIVVMKEPSAEDVAAVRQSFGPACPVIAAQFTRGGFANTTTGADMVILDVASPISDCPFSVLLTTPESVDDAVGWELLLDQARTMEKSGAMVLFLAAPPSDYDRRSLIVHAGVILRPHLSVPIAVWDCESDQEALTHLNADRADFAVGVPTPRYFPTIVDRLGLNCLLDPDSVLVVGASQSPEKAGKSLMSNMAQFAGEVVGLSRSTGEVQGRRIVADVADIGFSIDLAILAIPNHAVPASLENLGRFGVGAAIVCSGGFAETGSEEGAALQKEIDQVSRRYGIRILGPNTSGMSLPSRKLHASFVPAVSGLKSGSVAVLAQSGGVAHAVALALNAEGIGIGTMIGTGNATDIDLPELVTAIVERGNHSAIALHLEGTTDGLSLVRAIAKATPEVPIVVLKAGVSDVDRLASSHTGALAGEWKIAQSLLTEAGAVVVSTLGDLVDSISTLALTRLSGSPRPASAGVVTGQAGPGILLTDRLQTLGISVPLLSAHAVERLENLLPALTHRQNPVDTGRPGPNFDQVVSTVGEDPAIDAVAVYVLLEPAALNLVSSLAKAANEINKPLVASTNGLLNEIVEVRDQLRDHGVALFVNPERAARGVWALFEDRRAAHLRQSARFEKPGISTPHQGQVPQTEAEAKEVLTGLGIGIPQLRVCLDRQEAQQAFDDLMIENGSIVVKVHSTEVGHKAAVGGVHLGVRTQADLMRALDHIDAIDRSDHGYLLEMQVGEGIDLFVAVRRDPSWGYVALLGVGGGAVETAGDVHVFSMPATVEGIRHRLADIAPDLEASAAAVLDILEQICSAVVTWPQVDSFEINPLRLTAGELVALDALVDCG